MQPLCVLCQRAEALAPTPSENNRHHARFLEVAQRAPSTPSLRIIVALDQYIDALMNGC